MRYLIMISFAIAIWTNADIAWGKVNCNIHKTYCAIVKLKPKINKTFAMKLSNEIYKASKLYKLDPYRLVAIARQESYFKMSARNKHTKSHKTITCNEWEVCTNVVTTTVTTSDFGLFQFHISTMRTHDLDITKVMTDMPFTVNFAAKLLAHKMKICEKLWPNTSWACYNSANPEAHQAYVKAVNRWYLGNKNDPNKDK